MTDYQKGYITGWQATQPQWVSADKRLPSLNGSYFTISQALKNFKKYPKGSVVVNTNEFWQDGQWWDADDINWRVLYWASPLEFVLPQELSLSSLTA